MSLNLGGGSTTSNYNIKPQVFDTCLKSDEQQEVAGQKTNHGGLSLCH
jgi:hypothetical protein